MGVLEGTGRVRVAGELLTLEPLSSLYVEPDAVLGDEHDVRARERHELVRECVRGGVDDNDERRVAGLVEQPGGARAVGGVGRYRLQHGAALAAQHAREGAREPVLRSDDQCVHAT